MDESQEAIFIGIIDMIYRYLGGMPGFACCMPVRLINFAISIDCYTAAVLCIKT